MDKDFKLFGENLFKELKELNEKGRVINSQLRILDYWMKNINSFSPYDNRYGFYICEDCYDKHKITIIDVTYGEMKCKDCAKNQS